MHFHTQSSYDYKGKSVTDEQIIKTLSENNISVVAITDHHIIDIDRIKKLQELGSAKEITVLPGIEFLSETRGKEPVHFIGIFPEDCNISYVWGQIENNTNIKKIKGEGKRPNEIYCNIEETVKLIKELGGIATIHAGDKTNSVENITHSLPHTTAQKTDIAYLIDIFELGKESDINGYKEIVFPAIKKNIPMIICSDDHNINDYKLKQNCWIKADPTFEGLKQIIYEPEERVKIQEQNPFLDFEKSFFSEINFKDDEVIFEDDELKFKKEEIKLPLNQNLVAIIGGRGEGKSMLTDYIASSFKDYKTSKEGNYRKNGNIDIRYQKTNHNLVEYVDLTLGDEQHSIDFIYINQGKLKNIAEKREEQESISKSIQKLAKLNVPENNKELSELLYSNVKSIHLLDDYFKETDNEGNKIHSLGFLEKEEKSIKSFIENITTTKNKERLENYSKNLKKVNELSEKKLSLNKLENSFKTSIEEINKQISQINGETSLIPLINIDIFKTQQDKISEWILQIDEDLKAVLKDIDNVKLEFKDYKGDLTTLLKDIDKFQTNLFEIQKIILEVRSKKVQYQKLIKSVFGDTQDDSNSLIFKLKNDYDNQKLKLMADWEEFSKIEDRDDLIPAQKQIMKNLLSDLSIEVNVKFDVNSFYSQIWDCIDGSRYRIKNNREAQKRHFEISDIDSFIKYLNTKYLVDYQSGNFHKDKLFTVFFSDTKRKDYIKIIPTLKYQEKDLNKISTGQKGTVYLKMKLATEAFSKPIIFDQPEDDLDNEFIMNNLIGLFKELKKYRQLIIVTHNANLVVNADAEQIIIANNDNGALSYVSGSLENKIINKRICDILEGGETAFTKRKDKYVFNE